MKRIVVISLAVVFLLLPALAMNCSSGEDNESADRAAVEATIKGYISSYNASDFEECITYFTDYSDEEEAKSALAYFRDLSGELFIRTMSADDPPMLAINILEIDESIASVEIELAAYAGSDQSIGSDEVDLKKVNGQWKISWEQ